MFGSMVGTFLRDFQFATYSVHTGNRRVAFTGWHQYHFGDSKHATLVNSSINTTKVSLAGACTLYNWTML